MSPTAIGAIAGVLVAVMFGLLSTQAGAGVAILVPLYAAVFAVLGAALGWLLGRTAGLVRRQTDRG